MWSTWAVYNPLKQDDRVAETKRKALFIDRDGIINEDTGYPHLPEQIRFRPGIFDLCRSAMNKGYLLIVITNQAGVAKGKFPEEDVKALHVWMKEQFKERGIDIAGTYYCPHHKDGVVPGYGIDCNCRKPKPGMIEQAILDFAIDVSASLVVGDKLSDRIDFPGLRSVIVKSKYTDEQYDTEDLSGVEAFLK
ncbi:MAG: HAD family hydrolase [Chitinispirillaceae bacterium]|nr:HAD family hydrolase [Chitinispirillaceae bacterium]